MVRRAPSADTREVVRLGARMFFEMGLDDSGEWRDRAEQRVRAGLDDGSVAAFVVDDEAQPGHLVASACATIAQRLPGPMNPLGRSAYIQYVCTDTSHRGRGLARAVMGALVDWCRTQHAGVVELHATADGERLYRSMGFTDGGNPALRLRLNST